MAQRSRSKPAFGTRFQHYRPTGWQSTTYLNYMRESMVDESSGRGRYNTVSHTKVIQPLNAIVLDDSQWFESWTNYSPVDRYHNNVSNAMAPIISAALNAAPEFQRNNKFELLPFLFDLDDTLAMATLKFWKQISYGAVEWGVMPLISDLKSLSNSVRDIWQGGISAGLSARQYEDGAPINEKLDLGYFRAEVKGMVRYNGSLSYDIPSGDLWTPLQIFADELGFHPDLKTVWDVIPLSFVGDYFLPIGDTLESIHPRGWFNPSFHFFGGYSVKYTVTCTEKNAKSGGQSSYQIYQRAYGVPITGSVNKPKTINWKAPNARQLFNTAYLARSRR